MDGNGRWAKSKNLPRSEGHRSGVNRVKEIVRASLEWGIKVVTFFAFSNENWQRPKKEISLLMRLFEMFLDAQINELHKNNVRFRVIGREDQIPKNLREKIRQAEEKTNDNTALTLVLALNYGARQEILDAVKKIIGLVMEGKMDIGDLTEFQISRHLYTAGLPEPDLLIRTSGEMRLSNFLLWQLSYAELYFAKEYWPDFGKREFETAIKEYQARERRFGRVNC